MNSNFSKSQAVWFTIINYLGVMIGTISTLFIYPHDKDLLGILRFIDGFAQILYPIMVLGASTALLNFQPKLNEYLQRKLFSYSLVSILWMIVFCGVGVGLLYAFAPLENKEYYGFAFAIAICLAYVDLFKRQATNLQKLAVPTFFEKIIPKIALPSVFILIVYFSKSLHLGLSVYLFSFTAMLLLSGSYLSKFFKPIYTTNFQDLFQEISKKSYYQYSLYAFCASLGSFFAFRIDSVMIPEFLTNEANGDFNIGVNLANALMIPATGVFALYSPIISKAVKENNISLLKTKYAEVAKNLYFIGIILYGCVLLGMHDFFQLLPTADKLVPTLPIIYILGANVVLNMATGFNTEIIAYSHYYRFNLIAILSLVVINIGLNYWLLTQTDYGIIGVACASLISMLVFNLSKLIFIYRKFYILPFNPPYVKTIIVSLVLLVLTDALPVDWLGKFNFIVKCSLFALVFTSIVYFTNWVPEFNISLQSILKKIKR